MTAYKALSRRASAEGMVLLENRNKVLPLLKGDRVSLFGRCQLDYYKSGTGSGGAVNVEYQTHVVDGLTGRDGITINPELLSLYKKWLQENPFDNGGGGWAAEPWFQKEMPLTNEIVETARANSDKAIIIIGRTAGEDQDNACVEGSYLLTADERAMLEKVTTHFEQVIVVLNVCNIIDMSWVNAPTYKHPISAVLYAWHGGIEGGNALGDILTGSVSPCGKLADTIAYRIEDYPSDRQFGHMLKNYYMEDIYVGYKYFETFAKARVQYPFGYGMSYTTFGLTVDASEVRGKGVNSEFVVRMTIENTGDLYSGREVVQLYFSQPQGALGKPALTLGGFVKSQMLKPGEQQTLELTLPFAEMASFDDSGATGFPWAYVLEAGAYRFYIGTSSQSAAQVSVDGEAYYYLTETLLVEQLEEAIAPVQSFDRFKPGELLATGEYSLGYEPVPQKLLSTHDRMLLKKPKALALTGNVHYTLQDVAERNIDMETFIAQLSVTELATLVKGEGMSSPKVTPGTAAAFGGVTESLWAYGIPVAAAADGPSGIRMDSGQKAFQVGIGTLLACTWDVALIESLYTFMGQELAAHKIDTLLGPGINIHRHPLNGRNFEYFSEDALLTGLMASAVSRGLKKGGACCTLKHFAANDQERERHVVDSIVSERALREIHLKPFEIAIKRGGANSIMTSYNPVNGIYAASNYGLNTTLLREQWGYKGIVMSDWWAKMNHPAAGGLGDTVSKSYMVMAQNDLYMVVGHEEAQDFSQDNLMAAHEAGELTVGMLQRSAMNICEFLMGTQSFQLYSQGGNLKSYEPSVDEPQVIDLKGESQVALHCAENRSLGIWIEEDGGYTVTVTTRYISKEMAQTACNFLINGAYAATAQLHGSQHAWKEMTLLTAGFKRGYYVIQMDFVKPGIEIDSLGIRRK